MTEVAHGRQEPILVVSDLTVRYGGVQAVDGFSLTVPAGQIIGLIGPNGAGKTSLVDALTGFARYTGQVSFLGTLLDGTRAHDRARRGLARTFQSGDTFDDLTVAENIFIGEQRRASWLSTALAVVSGRPERPSPRTEQLIDTFGLHSMLGIQVKELSEGQRKLVAVTQALASGARLVFLDEPAAGLDTTESTWLGEKLRAVRDAGVAIVLVDHDMELVRSVCDEIAVLDFGRLIAVGRPEDVLADERVVAAYLGSVTMAGEIE